MKKALTGLFAALLLVVQTAVGQFTIRPTIGQFTPSLNLDFTKGTLPSGVSFSRSSIGTYFDASGVMQTASANVPRFDYDPVTLTAKGLLIEESRTNLLIWFQFNAGASGTIHTSGQPAPTGGNSGILVVPNTNSGNHYVRNFFTAALGTAYTFSAYLKPSGYNTATLIYGDGGNYYAEFNLTGSGSITTSLGVTATIKQVSSGYYFCTITRTFTSATNATADVYVWNYSFGAYSGNGTNGIVVYGGQIEAGSFATSYIPTTSAAVTRATDFVSLTALTSISSNQGTIIYHLRPAGFTNAPNVFSLNDGTNSNRYELGFTSAGVVRAFCQPGGQSFNSSYTTTAGSLVKMGMSYDATSINVTANNASLTTRTNSSASGLNRIYLGVGTDFVVNTCTWISKLTYFPRRLPDNYLKSLTQ